MMLAFGVSAADLTVSTTSLSTPDTKPTGTFELSFIVKNATQNLTGLTLSQSGLTDFDINFSVNDVPTTSFNLNTGEEKTIKVNGNIPDDINTRLSPFSGTLTISGGGIPSKTINLDVNAESQLELDNVKFVVNGKSKSISEGDTRNDVLPGAKLEIEGEIKNTFSDDDDINIEDVTVEITIRDLEDEGDDDAENDEDVGDIDADKDESFSIEFDIPEDIEAGEYDVTIIVEGDDENGAKHSVEWDDVKIKVEKDKHDIWITKASVSPSKVDCSRNIDVDVELKNQGEQDEDEVLVRIESSALDIDYEDNSIPELQEGAYDEDTEYNKAYPFEISDKVKAGTYQISVKAFYDTDTLSDSEIVTLTVEKCEAEEEPDEDDETVVVVSPPSDDDEEPEILTTEVTETTETSLFKSNTYMFLLAGAVGIAVIVIIIMVLVLFSMKKREI